MQWFWSGNTSLAIKRRSCVFIRAGIDYECPCLPSWWPYLSSANCKVALQAWRHENGDQESLVCPRFPLWQKTLDNIPWVARKNTTNLIQIYLGVQVNLSQARSYIFETRCWLRCALSEPPDCRQLVEFLHVLRKKFLDFLLFYYIVKYWSTKFTFQLKKTHVWDGEKCFLVLKGCKKLCMN
jgi:hypothetical protein